MSSIAHTPSKSKARSPTRHNLLSKRSYNQAFPNLTKLPESDMESIISISSKFSSKMTSRNISPSRSVAGLSTAQISPVGLGGSSSKFGQQGRPNFSFEAAHPSTAVRLMSGDSNPSNPTSNLQSAVQQPNQNSNLMTLEKSHKSKRRKKKPKIYPPTDLELEAKTLKLLTVCDFETTNFLEFYNKLLLEYRQELLPNLMERKMFVKKIVNEYLENRLNKKYSFE